MSRQIILDTETTGLSVFEGDRLIELGCVEMVNRKLTGNNLHLYFNAGRDSHPDALRVHGITTEFLKDKPRFADKIDEIWEYLQGAEIIIHNAPFDLGFLNNELKLAKRPPIQKCVSGVIDTLVMAKEMYPGKRNSLDSLCDRLGVDNSNRTLHGALLDSELLADVYINLTRGQDALLMTEEPAEAQTAGAIVIPSVDLSTFKLPVLRANEQEQQAHDDVLQQLDKSSGGKTAWRSFENVGA
ncbi:DNA polymerase III subunit epsilon [Comamonas sp. Y33R10-2]|uniref:DNA polymerase III subunit epsilon n=1 Tax=Comamonas sp. Y33R10-2 TaxID=2853257 RepID=UPI001C5C86F3|nr:DNA polymerase III subunit epsilon [Comamonas sp. Y33R10-2]QXZ10843.1 DNA polymerase III subunit epsilon [Comamonas sp. Y33R10-2]